MSLRCTPIVSFLMLGTLFVAMSSSAALSQDAERPPDGGTREVLVSIFIPSLANAPFAATVNTEWVRQFADGTTITLKNHRAIARDKAGRIFQERRMLVPDDGKHDSFVTQIEISDPVGHKLYICVPSEHVCQLEYFAGEVVEHAKPRPSIREPGATTHEDLGTKTVEGIEVAGTLESAVIKAGAIGNDNPISIKREFWYSSQLGLNLISKRQDPRFGTQTFELSDIALGEPDPKLFRTPAGFKVIDLQNASRNERP